MGAVKVWMYPSEHMFFNAMKRKGWDPREDDMPAVVNIHNSVNERAWREVMSWESIHAGAFCCCALRRTMYMHALAPSQAVQRERRHLH
eukprot:360194-Chlamydomonas_euryale.AAC.9